MPNCRPGQSHCSLKTTISSRIRLAVALLIGGLLAGAYSRAAELQIVVFSGRPDPVVSLEDADLTQIGRILAEASPVHAKDPTSAFPAHHLGYRGVRVRGWQTNEPMDSMRVRGEDIFFPSGTNGTWFRAPDTRLERYLVDLAAARGVLSEALHQEIRLEIQKNSPDTLFLDDFDCPLNPIWSGTLPTTTNTYPTSLMTYTGGPGYLFERIGVASVLRFTNTLADQERRGWSTRTNFFSTDFRCEVRVNPLDISSSRGGVIELWLRDSRDPEIFDFTSIFIGLSSAPMAIAARSSVGGDFGFRSWFNPRSHTFYRLILEGSNSEPMRAAVLTDSGEEIFSFRFQHTASAFTGGMNVAISHCGRASGSTMAWPNEAAVDFVQLTGKDSAAIEHRNSLYRFGEWGGQTTARYDNLLTNWTPDFAALGVTNFLLRAEGIWTNAQKAANYLWEDPTIPGVPIRLRTWEGNDVLSAHGALLDQSAIIADAEPLPLASTLGIDLGDRSYLEWGATDSFLFVRNNVLIYLSGGPSALRLARLLDSQLLMHSFRGPVILRPQVTSGVFHFAAATTLGKTYLLESKHSLSATNWIVDSAFIGDGTIRTLAIPVSPPQKFLRLRLD
jgi:hypothetical protein